MGSKLPRLSSVREEALLASLEQAWASAAKAQCGQQGVPPSARAALERYLHGMQASIFSAVRSSRSASSASASAEAAEPVDRELALEVARLEKAVEKLGKTVKETRDSVSACAAHCCALACARCPQPHTTRHKIYSPHARPQTRATLPAAIRGRQKSRYEALTAAIVPVQEDEGAGQTAASSASAAGRGSKGRRASAAAEGGAGNGAVLANDTMTADAIKSQARELHEALAGNKAIIPALVKDANQVLSVLEKK